MSEIFFTQADWQLFTNINTLPQQAGVAKHLLPKLVAKELTDNALDTGAKVEIKHESDGLFEDTIIIRDFGQGFSGSNEEIANFFSINRPLTSSKRFRLPMRGALGNGLRVVVATVYCLNGSLEVSTNGRKLKLTPQDDGRTSFEEVGQFQEEGTEIRVSIPDNFFGEDILTWANLALQINQGKNYQGKTNPFWYDSDSFYNLMLSLPEKVDFVEFLAFFDKINSTKAKKIIKNTAFANLEEIDRTRTDKVLAALRRASKVISAKKLGYVGELEDFQAYHKAVTQFGMKTSKGDFEAEIPAVVEVWGTFSESEKNHFFVNKTPITGDADISFYQKRLSIYGCGLNEHLDKIQLQEQPVFWVNIITPYMPIVSNGKEPDFSVVSESIAKAVKKVANQLKNQTKKDNTPNGTISREKIPSQKKVVIERIEEAIAKASGEGKYRYSLRQLYYVLRPFVMEATGRELKYANFNNIITDYEHDEGQDLRGVYRDERGTLLHPHTHEEIRLGTKSIEKYSRPIFTFNKILYSEKEGFFEILKDAGFCEKHDCALLTSKGFASRAARDVIDLLAETEEELLFFCIHDADLSGTLIYQALQGATKARPKRKVKIINLGLEAWEGLEMQLEVESLERRSSKTPAQYVLDFDTNLSNTKPFQLGYERWNSWEEWLKSFRVELNAMDTPTFVTWLDAKISKYDSVGKVVPDEHYLKKEADANLQANLRQDIRQAILVELDIEKLVNERFEDLLPSLQRKLEGLDLESNIKSDLDDNPQQSWQTSFLEVLKEILDR